ncbi:visual system homeobox 2-like isoform X1 [Biomphalaria pfeifferi]|uniref:Visual system homeobox 2-like isoform X1 n=1 Tax=Biomphalaria pfeifferi TaxID=112525 RepID=A0AAD8AY34_BIOPF|nr:visual system homeobox 2-like isoform X1 [Biomphalaria pfeifferi]
MVRHSLPLPETIVKSAKEGVLESSAPWLLSMYRKSIESGGSKSSEGGRSSPDNGQPGEQCQDGKKPEDFRSESIAALRARAQEYTAKNFPRSSENGDDTLDSDAMVSDYDDSNDSYLSASLVRRKDGSDKDPAKSPHSYYETKLVSRAHDSQGCRKEGAETGSKEHDRYQKSVRDSRKIQRKFANSPLTLSSAMPCHVTNTTKESVTKPSQPIISSKEDVKATKSSSKQGQESPYLTSNTTPTPMIYCNSYSQPPPSSDLSNRSSRQNILNSSLFPPSFNYLNSHLGINPNLNPGSPNLHKNVPLPLNFPGSHWGNPFSGFFPGISHDHLKNNPFLNSYGFGALDKTSWNVQSYLSQMPNVSRLSQSDTDISDKKVAVQPPNPVIAL